ncbi:MAG: acetyl-CoA hydrolase/transferase C-terminal domain-containing protein [Eubacterium sp.]
MDNAMNVFEKELEKKTISAKKAAQLVKDGDRISYSDHALVPLCFDAALAVRSTEVKNVVLKTCNMAPEPAFIKAGISRDHIAWIDRHFNGVSRKYGKAGMVNYVVSDYGHMPLAYERFLEYDIFVLEAAPMDTHGYFNFGLSNSEVMSALRKSKVVIVETNENIPVVYGGYGEAIHISEVDYVISGNNRALMTLGSGKLDESQRKIAELIVEQVEDGACLQLGIGALPNAIGEMICDTDVKNLGAHTEMLTDAFMKLYDSGKLTGSNKTIDKGKIVFSFAMGSQELYEFVDRNPVCAAYPVDYVNDVATIAKNDKVLSINNALEIDLFTQVSAESSGFTQISGTGGQLDFVWGSYMSRGGKSIIALTSTVVDKTGAVKSRIVPSFSEGTIVTTPRSVVDYIVTEYGIVPMKGLSTWERAEKLIGLAHPDFRDELIKEAERMNIWKYSNKRDY